MKIKQLLFMSFITAFILSTVVLWVVKLSFLPFWINLQFVDTDAILNLSKDTVMLNFNELVDYLINSYVFELNLSNIPVSDSGAFHFMEVKQIFTFIKSIQFVAFVGTFFFILSEKNIKDYALYKKLSKYLCVFPVVMILIIATSFNFWFVLFHHIVFNNQDWLFNPITDPIILVLNEHLFLVYFIICIVLFEIILFIFYKIMCYKYDLALNNVYFSTIKLFEKTYREKVADKILQRQSKQMIIDTLEIKRREQMDAKK